MTQDYLIWKIRYESLMEDFQEMEQSYTELKDAAKAWVKECDDYWDALGTPNTIELTSETDKLMNMVRKL